MDSEDLDYGAQIKLFNFIILLLAFALRMVVARDRDSMLEFGLLVGSLQLGSWLETRSELTGSATRTLIQCSPFHNNVAFWCIL